MLLRVVVGVEGTDCVDEFVVDTRSRNTSFEGLGDSACTASPSNVSERVRSSHFPLIVSTLWETRWLVHRLGGGEFPDVPVVLESNDAVDVELVLDSEPERFMDEVRSSNRIW